MRISKPNVVKGIPVPLIRPLPTLYYYGRYANGKKSTEASTYFRETIDYICSAIQLLHQQTDDDDFLRINTLCSDLKECSATNITNCTEKITSQLSDCCSEHATIFKEDDALSKEQFFSIYKAHVKPLKTLLIDNNDEPDKSQRISTTFTNTCFFDVIETKPRADKYIDMINQSDFVVFLSARPMTIHDDVQDIQAHQKPLVVFASLTKDDAKDQQTLRNGAWLQNKGHEVLYKIFTPLRLFTTVDKLYMKFHLS